MDSPGDDTGDRDGSKALSDPGRGDHNELAHKYQGPHGSPERDAHHCRQDARRPTPATAHTRQPLARRPRAPPGQPQIPTWPQANSLPYLVPMAPPQRTQQETAWEAGGPSGGGWPWREDPPGETSVAQSRPAAPGLGDVSARSSPFYRCDTTLFFWSMRSQGAKQRTFDERARCRCAARARAGEG